MGTGGAASKRLTRASSFSWVYFRRCEGIGSLLHREPRWFPWFRRAAPIRRRGREPTCATSSPPSAGVPRTLYVWLGPRATRSRSILDKCSGHERPVAGDDVWP
jgi:hypothetical protein